MEISITVLVNGSKVWEREVVVGGDDWDQGMKACVQEVGKVIPQVALTLADAELARQVPKGWENLGREERRVLSVVGMVPVQRRVYRDEKGQRRKPLDELLGLGRYARTTRQVQGLGAYIASYGPYRQAARQVSWLLQEKVSVMGVLRMAWAVGEAWEKLEEGEREAIFREGAVPAAGKVKAEILFGEADGVWIALQRERQRRAEVRVGILYAGKEALAPGRYALRDKVSLTALGEDSESWQEKMLALAYRHYDLGVTRQVVAGGDGTGWVRQTLARLELPLIYQLDRFHLYRAARRGPPQARRRLVGLVQRGCAEGWGAIEAELRAVWGQQEGEAQAQVGEFYRYLAHNADGLLDYRKRLHLDEKEWQGLGAIEGNVDKLVVQRMKGRGMSWRLPGAQAMLALCRHRQELAERVLPLAQISPSHHPAPSPRRRARRRDATWLSRPVPVLHNAAGRPWVQNLRRQINGDTELSFSYPNSP